MTPARAASALRDAAAVTRLAAARAGHGAQVRAAQPAPVSPALPQHLQERSKRRENRVADQTTRSPVSQSYSGDHGYRPVQAVPLGRWPAAEMGMAMIIERLS